MLKIRLATFPFHFIDISLTSQLVGNHCMYRRNMQCSHLHQSLLSYSAITAFTNTKWDNQASTGIPTCVKTSNYWLQCDKWITKLCAVHHKCTPVLRFLEWRQSPLTVRTVNRKNVHDRSNFFIMLLNFVEKNSIQFGWLSLKFPLHYYSVVEQACLDMFNYCFSMLQAQQSRVNTCAH